jgi:hypothetical protein
MSRQAVGLFETFSGFAAAWFPTPEKSFVDRDIAA